MADQTATRPVNSTLALASRAKLRLWRRRQSRVLEGSRRTWVMLILAAMLPLLLSGGWIASYYADQTRARTRRAASDTVERAAGRIAAELSGQLQVAEALAASSALDNGDLQAFREEAARVMALQPLWHTIELTAPSNVQLVNMLRPEGEPLGPTADLDSFQKLLDTKRPTVGGIGPVGPVSGRRLVTLRVPVLRNGALRYVLSFAMAPDSVATILRTAGAPRNWIGVVVDGSGHVITRTVNEGPRTGTLASAAFREAVANAPAGTYAGRTAEGIPVDTDYRALPGVANWTVAFGIPSQVLEAPFRHALYILGASGGAGLALAALLTSLVARDVTQRRRDERERATRALSASEQRRALALDAADLGAWRWDMMPDRFDGSARCRALLGLPPPGSEPAVERWLDVIAQVHWEDQAILQSAMDRCRDEQAPLQCEFRVAGAAGSVRWLRMDGRVQDGVPDQVCSVQGVIADISARRKADADHLLLMRRLAQAQEDERRRISRELHDQVGQTVTGLSLGLKAMQDAIANNGIGVELAERCQWLRSLTEEIGRDIHRTASDLRPTTLDDFGLHRAVETFVGRWDERYGVQVDLQAVGIVGRMAPDIETAVYRIIQEALTNVFKHAQATNVSIVLERLEKHLRVIVEDDGAGFDPDAVAQDGDASHLGLSGIRERLLLVGGTMVMESEPGAGATLFIQVPLQPVEPGPTA
jgi:two-component system sensor histidine kinase UhpB